jgi:hypothetical protein
MSDVNAALQEMLALGLIVSVKTGTDNQQEVELEWCMTAKDPTIGAANNRSTRLPASP